MKRKTKSLCLKRMIIIRAMPAYIVSDNTRELLKGQEVEMPKQKESFLQAKHKEIAHQMIILPHHLTGKVTLKRAPAL
jgi:hypothetical protein